MFCAAKHCSYHILKIPGEVTLLLHKQHTKNESQPELLMVNSLDVSSILPELQMTNNIYIKTVVNSKLLIDKLPVSKQLRPILCIQTEKARCF